MVSYSESGEMAIDYKAMGHKDYKADEYKADETLAKGPKDDRKCTDMLCCLAFLVVCGLMFFWCIDAYIVGEPSTYFMPVSGDNSICGYAGSDTADYSYLYIPKLTLIKAGTNVNQYGSFGCCVNSCPTTAGQNYETMGCDSAKDVYGVSNYNATDAYVTTSWHKYCIPVMDDLDKEQKTSYAILEAQFVSISLGSFVMSLYEARWVFVISMVISLVLALGYIKFMDWCAYWLSWVILVVMELSLIGCGIAAACESSSCHNDDNCSDTAQGLYDASMWTSFVLAALYLLLIACKFKQLQVSIAVIETAADFFADSKRIIIVPCIYFTMAVAVFALWFFGVICLASNGTFTGSYSSQMKSVDRTALINDRIAWMVIFYIWIATLIHALNEYTIIVSACTWYFSRKDIPDDDGIPGDSDIWKGFWWSYRYNFGSLCFGSAVLTVVTIVKDAIAYMGDALVAGTAGNPVTVCIMCCINCCMECFDRCVRFLTQSAYIYMALSGDSFCTSAVHAFLVVIKNAAKFSFVNSLAGFFMFMAKFSIAILTTLSCYGILKAWPSSFSGTDTNEGFVLPLIGIFILSYVICAMFIGIFDVSSNTILMCYIWDLEIAKGGKELDPAHVPATLAKFIKIHGETVAQVQEEVAEEKALGGEATQNLIS